MSFPNVLTGGNLTTIRAGEYSAVPYLLVNPNEVVFAAQVNQASFDLTFATVTFDNITTGALADALEGFTVYIGATTNIRSTAKSGFVGRVRPGSTGTTLNINETSAVIEDDWFIVVVKDVAIREKLGRYVSKVMKTDWDTTFRPPLPRVTGLDSCYVGALVAGISDFTFPAVGNPTTSGAAIASWLWDADGGSFINGTANTDAQPDIRYTVAGVYWPRVTVTDDNGVEGWFTMPVFVPSTDLSNDFIVTGLESLSISSQLATGQEMTFTYFSDELDDVVKQTFVALWVVDDYNGSATPILNEIAFVGRMRKEDPKHTVDKEAGVLPETPFTCEGILGQLVRIRAPQLALTFDSTPTQFGEINNMTQWRCASFILTEFSTVANVCSLSFDVEDNTYLNREDSTDNTNLLAGVNGLLSALSKGALNQSSTGQLFGARNANYMTTAQRNALDTIATFTDNDTFSETIAIDQANAVGQITGFAGGYNSVDNSLRILRASAPAIASNAGQGIGSPINGILLASDATLTAQKTEIEQIVADGLADSNPKDIPKPGILDGYWFLMPTNFQWYGYLMSADENNRGIVYDATDRFLLTGMNLSFDNIVSSWVVSPTLAHETQGGAAQTISQVQPNAVPPALPSIPPLPAYPAFPPLPSLWTPVGSIIIPPLLPGDANIIKNPIEPFAQVETKSLAGEVGLWFDDFEVQVALDVASNINPTWEVKFTFTTGYTIMDAKFNPFTLGAWVLENDGAGSSKFWRTDNVFESIPTWAVKSFSSDIDYTTIRTTATPERVYIFGIDDRGADTAIYNMLGGGGQGISEPSDHLMYNTGDPPAFAPGVYNSGSDLYDGVESSIGGVGCNVEVPVLPGYFVDSITVHYRGDRDQFQPAAGDKNCVIRLDDLIIGSLSYLGGSYNDSVRIISMFEGAQWPADLPATKIYVHGSMDRLVGGGMRVAKLNVEFRHPPGIFPAYRLSDDSGETFDNLILAGATIGAVTDESGFDSGAADDFCYLGADDIIREAENNDPPDDKTDSDSAGTYSKAIWAYGKNVERDLIFATDAAYGGITMARIVNDVAADITPNDGADDGLVISRNGICMSRVSDTHIWFVGTFNVTVKLAYTDDAGATPWTVSALALTTGAIYIRVKNTNTNQVYIMDSNVIKYSEDGGANFLTDRTAPGIAGLGFEVR